LNLTVAGAPPEAYVLGIRVDGLTLTQALARCIELAVGPPGAHVVTVNTEYVMAARRNAAFREVLNGAALALPDAAGVVWAARLLGTPFPERVAGADLVPRLAGSLGERGLGVFLLGAAPGVAAEAGRVLVRAHGARVAGSASGSPRPEDAAALVEMIRAARPAALFVAFGAPAQDLWIARHLAALEVPLAMGVGGTFDFLAGVRRRAPHPVRRAGLEWLWRLAHEPRRWRRQLALPQFAVAVLLEWVRRGGARRV
jgi:N-acetylglucosaminyldiphosphoundecaprenol N-acetyl-beta-D-mannosaminyltransferase